MNHPPAPIPVQPLSYDTGTAEASRSLVRISPWALFVWLAFTVGAVLSNYMGQAAIGKWGMISGVNSIFEDWKKVVIISLFILSCPAVLMGGILANRMHSAARIWLICGALLAIVALLSDRADSAWEARTFYADLSVYFWISEASWMLANLLVPAGLILFMTRPSVKRLFRTA